MAITTSYPGIYLSKDASLNYSISVSATTIPVFITNGTQSGIPSAHCTLFNSWGEVLSTIPKEYNDQYYYIALRFWFLQGGGKCYILDYDELRKNAIPDDCTLIVGNGNSSHVIQYFDNFFPSNKKLFILLDGPSEKITADSDVSVVTSIFPESSYAAVFYPWVLSDWAKKPIPPSVVAAIAIAKTDSTRGPWKAPANVVIEGITPQYPVSDDLQGRFNQGKALDMIRTFPDGGTVVWGTRTLEDSDNWRYIPVRRLFNMVERDIQKSLQKLVFEPNSQPTWQRVKAAIDNYLYRLWQQGALAGNKESDAWFVEIGKDITMTDDDINQGKMIVKVALAAVRPAEFILLQFSQDIAQ